MSTETNIETSARSRRVLLVLDYPGRRTEAGVRDLRLEHAGWDPVYLLRPPFGRATTSASYAAALTTRFGPFGTEVHAVLAYCMAAPVAQEITAALNAADVPAPLVLFDGEPVTAEVVAREVRLAEDRVRGPGTGVGLPAATAEELASAPEHHLASMRTSLVELGAAALRAEGADVADAEPEAADAAEFYLDWLGYLLANHNTTWPRLRHPVHHVVSRQHRCTGEWPGAPATRLHRVAAPRDTLLAHPDTRALVRDLLDDLVPAVRPPMESGSRR